MTQPTMLSPRTSSLSGGGLVLAISALLGLTPFFPGVGYWWTLVLVVGGFLVWQNKIAPPLEAIVTPATVALGVGATLFLASASVGFLPWLLASVLLVQGLGARLDWSRARAGYTLFVAGAFAACLLCLRQVWFDQPDIHTSMSMGSLDYTFGWAPSTPVGVPGAGMSWYWQYNPRYMPWTIPGYQLSGLSMQSALPMVMILTSLLGWSLWSNAFERQKAGRWMLGGAILVLAWSSTRATQEHPATLGFFLGVLAMIFAAWKIGQGQDAGDFDLDDMKARYRNSNL